MAKKILLLLVLMTGFTCKTSNSHLINDRSWQIFKLVNQFRRENGVPELKYLWIRQLAVNVWASHLEKRYEHAPIGYYACENIAYNYDSPEALFTQWENSPPHRRNMLLPTIKYCAIAVHLGSFRGKRGAYFGVFRGYK